MRVCSGVIEVARPIKEGMDYFPHDTDAVNDEKIEALRAIYGNDGYAFYFIVLERIYRTRNAELNVSAPEALSVLAKKVGVRRDKFNKILETALKVNCFDKELYTKSKKLTSNGIRHRASFVLGKRAEMRKKYAQSKPNEQGASSPISDAETPQETTPETPQSKVNKTKEKKESSRPIPTELEIDLLEVLKTFPGWIYKEVQDLVWLRDFERDYPAFTIDHAKGCRDYHSSKPIANSGIWKARLRQWLKHDKQFGKERGREIIYEDV